MLGVDVRKDVRTVLALGLAVVGPVSLALLLMLNSRGPNAAMRSSEMVTYALVLAASVFVYFHWRMVGVAPSQGSRRLAGWLTVALLAASLQKLGQVAMIDPVPAVWRDFWPLVSQTVILVVLIAMTYLAARVDVPRDPALLGAIGGLLLTGGTIVVLRFTDPSLPSRTGIQLLNALMLLAGVMLAWTIWQRTHVSAKVRGQLALAAVLLTLAQSLAHLDTHNRWVVTLAVVANFQGALVLLTLSQSLLRSSILGHQDELMMLQETLAKARADVLEERELLHEVGSTVAGITTASRVMSQDSRLTHERRQRLEQMLTAELARLDRLMTSRHPEPARVIDVSEVVEPLVTSHRERGLDVQWTPQELHAVGDPDDLAEVVNILLENARRHGGQTVLLEVSDSDGYVEVTCSDNGPGIADEVRPQLFDSGARRSDSPGQGLGLSIAQRLMSECGGSLELADSVRPGATFVARLPMSEMAHVAVHHVA
ncbi:MAG TPA: sensor histidine kinase [Nocardioides sp.]|uniref:sensor histidine kinase n=1 Tax=uncultured Nocardioides sp. TaxID=198441 RepID=UPI0026067273|nr:sensor histidine kinase [uncultured Nocardioides sp.]HRD60228.1 sensor histidine kinase [Nocardioides sp.]HRI96774.1 sensor histidine kinase [Nocardioides sp.]HRK47563.1 sensor histidine kinase [Nocardioides sp.]